MLEKDKYVLGERHFKEFGIGDCVSWKPLNRDKQYGIITSTFVNQIGTDDRYVAMAKVRASYGGDLDLMLNNLHLESKVIRCLSMGINNT